MTILYPDGQLPGSDRRKPLHGCCRKPLFLPGSGLGGRTRDCNGLSRWYLPPKSAGHPQELVTFYWRYANLAGCDMTISQGASLAEYQDGDSVKPYAKEAMLWAVDTGLTGAWMRTPWPPTALASPGYGGYNAVPHGCVKRKSQVIEHAAVQRLDHRAAVRCHPQFVRNLAGNRKTCGSQPEIFSAWAVRMGSVKRYGQICF